VQEALARALQTWPFYGVPQNPSAWIMRASRNLALDAVRRQKNFRDKEPEIIRTMEREISAPDELVFSEQEIPDDRLRLIFRGNDWHKGLSPEQTQQVSDRWMAWFKRLTDEGRAIAGNPLEPKGKIVSGKNGRVVADGPFAESKEAIGGYFLLRVGSLDEAVAVAQECPGLPYGARIEVRPVAGECPLAEEARAESQSAAAAA